MLRQIQKFGKIIRNRKQFFSFTYTSRGTNTQFNDEFLTTFNKDGKLLPNQDHSIIADHDDKFGLRQIRDPTKILIHLKSVDFKYTFNDLIFFLKHLVYISEEHGLRSQIISNYNFKEFLNHIKKCLITNQMDKFPLIGSYAYCFQKLNINDIELWRLLEQQILDDHYHTTFQESVFAVQGFTKLPLMYYGKNQEFIQEKLDKIYKKLERVIRITIWEVNPIHYHSIVTALAQVNRFDPQMFSKLEQHILTNLSLNYTTKMMVDILFCFAKGKQGSLQFYDSMQYVIFKGHMFNRNYFLQSLSELSYDGHLVAGLLGIYKEAQDKYNEFQLHPDFQNKVHNLMINRLTNYDLESLIKTLDLLPTFIKDDYQNIRQKLLPKILKLDGQFQIQDILRFYQYIEQNYDDIKKAPLKEMEYIENNLYKYSNQVSIDDLIVILQYLYERPKFIQQPDRFIEQVINTLDQNINFMTSQQIDLFTSLFTPFIEYQKNLIGNSTQIIQTTKKLKDIQLIKSYYQKQLQ